MPKEIRTKDHIIFWETEAWVVEPPAGGSGQGEDVEYKIYAKILTQIKEENIKYFFSYANEKKVQTEDHRLKAVSNQLCICKG